MGICKSSPSESVLDSKHWKDYKYWAFQRYTNKYSIYTWNTAEYEEFPNNHGYSSVNLTKEHLRVITIVIIFEQWIESLEVTLSPPPALFGDIILQEYLLTMESVHNLV